MHQKRLPLIFKKKNAMLRPLKELAAYVHLSSMSFHSRFGTDHFFYDLNCFGFVATPGHLFRR